MDRGQTALRFTLSFIQVSVAVKGHEVFIKMLKQQEENKPLRG